jgi:hypothetical protein
MTIRVELNPETEARLIVEACAKGLPLEKLAEQLLKEALAERSTSLGRMSAEELHRMFSALAEGSGRPQDLPSGSFPGESFNEGRSAFGRWRPW